MELLNLLGYHEKWHTSNSARKRCKYSINEPIIEEILETINIKNGMFLEFGAWDLTLVALGFGVSFAYFCISNFQHLKT